MSHARIKFLDEGVLVWWYLILVAVCLSKIKWSRCQSCQQQPKVWHGHVRDPNTLASNSRQAEADQRKIRRLEVRKQ